MAIPYPNIPPTLIKIGPLALHWYGLAYIIGIIGGYIIIQKKLSSQLPLNNDQKMNFILYISIGILLGGRLGYILFYNASYYLKNPFEIVALWQGGMAFHGGILGAIVAMILFSKHNKGKVWAYLDLIALVAPLGIGLGRICNFINGELYGRVTTLPWGMVFPTGGPLPRHPSQLYEAVLEGLILGLCLYRYSKTPHHIQHPGNLACLFALLYSSFRFIIEFVREPDPQLGLLYLNLSMGQWLCIGLASISLISFYLQNRIKKR
ncbi:MAG: prolipoprotein diacylglyceryl transferase [bacterium]